jgi:hypothetical protein
MTCEQVAEFLNKAAYRDRSDWEEDRSCGVVQFKSGVIPGERLYLSELEATTLARGFSAERENLKLRRMLATSSGTLTYTDDGELQDTSERPWIDYLRDSADEIEEKRRQRFIAKWRREKPECFFGK